MTNTLKLKAAIVEKGTTQQHIADEIGIDRSTFYRKMHRGGCFTVAEANAIVSALKLSKDEATAIFFANTIA